MIAKRWKIRIESHGTISDIVNGKTKSSKQIPYHFKIIKKGDKTKWGLKYVCS